MVAVLRIIFPACFLWCLHAGSQLADASRGTATTPAELGYIALCLVSALGSGIVWAPAIGARVAQPVTDIFVDVGEVPQETKLMTLADALRERGWRRTAALLCCLEGWWHPSWPGAFLLGLRCARPGSRLELHFARHVYQFENARNCWTARQILRRHGREPALHPQLEVQRLMVLWEREPDLAPRETLPLIHAPPGPAIPRNPVIQLPKDAGACTPDAAEDEPPVSCDLEPVHLPPSTHPQLP